MNKFTLKKLFLFISFLVIPVLCFAQNSSDKKWIIAAQKFEYSKGQSQNAVTQAMESTLPSDILEKMNKTLQRNVYPDERLERTRFQLRTERQSLYLQLTADFKKRDSLVLQNYSEAKLKKDIKEQEKKIEEIKKKINENLAKVKQKEDALQDEMKNALKNQDANPLEDNEFVRLTKLAKKLFSNKESLITTENIAFYKDDVSALCEYPLASEKEICSAQINTLLTGRITQHGEFICVEVDMYLFPGTKKLITVMEIGLVQDMEFITTSIANQLMPHLTNSFPVEINFAILPEQVASLTEVYIDDVLQKTGDKAISFQSGVHSIQFACEGYKTASTSYYFEGNKKYNIEVELVEIQEGLLTIQLKKIRKHIEGELLVNGYKTEEIENRRTQITINGNQILGEFIAENGLTAFFYIPEKLSYDGALVQINPKPFDRDKYIDTRRKWCYGAYSAFMVSLIPYFYTYGTLMNNAELYYSGQMPYKDAKKWQEANNICAGISIGCGVFWSVELVRYLVAANSVLPQKAKKGKNK